MLLCKFHFKNPTCGHILQIFIYCQLCTRLVILFNEHNDNLVSALIHVTVVFQIFLMFVHLMCYPFHKAFPSRRNDQSLTVLNTVYSTCQLQHLFIYTLYFPQYNFLYNTFEVIFTHTQHFQHSWTYMLFSLKSIISTKTWEAFIFYSETVILIFIKSNSFLFINSELFMNSWSTENI